MLERLVRSSPLDTPHSFSIATGKELWRSGLTTLVLSAILAVGFIPTSQTIFHALVSFLHLSNPTWVGWGERLAFPLLGAFFWLTFPSQKKQECLSSHSLLIQTSVFPILIAIVFGWLHPAPSLWSMRESSESIGTASWILLCAPIGEELLFRGWVYDLYDKWCPKMATATNPYPVALWVSSMSFSLWHFQNLGSDSAPAVIFQVFYTFFAGLWLGFLRWRSGGVAVPMVAHFALNLGSVVL
jgi:membrane protease YdiL (CAAX protease family)